MKFYDISQEVFGCAVYPGDPVPERMRLQDMSEGAEYNLTAFSMCAHNGTHVDAPLHYLRDGESIDAIGLDAFVGKAYVAEHHGILSSDYAKDIFDRAMALVSIPMVGSHFVRYREPPIPHGGASRFSFRKPTFLYSETKHFCWSKNNPHIEKNPFEKCST